MEASLVGVGTARKIVSSRLTRKILEAEGDEVRTSFVAGTEENATSVVDDDENEGQSVGASPTDEAFDMLSPTLKVRRGGEQGPAFAR